MSKPIIAIDIDDVLADYAAEFVVMSNKLWGTNLTIDDYDEDWMKIWGVDDISVVVERGKALFEDRMHERLRHKDDATAVLNELSKDYRLTIITARHIVSKDMTVEWVARHYPMIHADNITFAGIWDNPDRHAAKLTKGAVAKSMGVDYIIDDQLKHCLAAAEHGIKALVFGSYSWNQMNDLPNNVTRVESWAEVGKYFKGEAGR